MWGCAPGRCDDRADVDYASRAIGPLRVRILSRIRQDVPHRQSVTVRASHHAWSGMQAFGYPLRILGFDAWLTELAAAQASDAVLRSSTHPPAGSAEDAEDGSTRMAVCDSQNAVKALEALGRRLQVNDTLLSTYLASLVRRGFISALMNT